MTRETKVGLVVATSFLSLIGGVLILKYSQPPAPVIAEAAAKPTPVDEGPLAVPGTIPVLPRNDDPNAIQPVTPATTSVIPPGPLPIVSTTPMNPAGDLAPIILPPTDLLPLPSSPAVSLSDEEYTKIFTHFNQTKTVRGMIGSGLLTKASMLMIATENARKKVPPFDLGVRLVGSDGSANPVTLPPPPATTTPPSLDGPMLTPVPTAPPKPADLPMPMGVGVTLPFPPLPPVAPMTPKPVDLPLSPVKPLDLPVPPKPADVGLPIKPLDVPPVPMTPKPKDVPPAIAPLDPKPVDVKPSPAPAFPSFTMPTPVLGSPTATTDPKPEPAAFFDPARTRPAATSAEANSYDEDWHSCKEGETFATLSQTFYRTEMYEKALRLYNVDRLGSDNLRQERPILKAGQTVRIPPARILESKYTAAVPGLTAGPRPATPVGLSGSPQSGPIATLGAVVPDRSDNGNGPTEYEVKKPGMTLHDIAKETLGSSDQWNRIFQLNRWLNALEPVPVGAKIYIPRAR